MKIYPTSDVPLLSYLYYEDPGNAISWLTKSFGASERFRLLMPNGDVAHAEVTVEGGVVMIGNVGNRNRERPSSVRSSIYAFVQDVDEHHKRAIAAGVEILEPPKDQPYGDRIYLARDCEGHEWYFAQHVRDVSIEDLAKALRR